MLLCGADDHCIERHFFYDDDDRVCSFESTYQRDPALEIADYGTWVQLNGRGLEGEARRRQQAIA